MKELIEKNGFTLEPWSTWDGDNGKFGIHKGFSCQGLMNTNDKTIRPCHGYYGGYFKNLAKEINYKLIEK